MQLDIRETNNLLSLSDNGYLYPKVRYDAIILYALEHKNQLSILILFWICMNYQF
ncbi:hypothetical protein SD457_04570 [Coprobacillaceae bacterium CR2/5/TPMF4]|nr:hypothetical protein SD457_04570 [Coprobacillaceae bacterium CR2/5/TPMF4]